MGNRQPLTPNRPVRKRRILPVLAVAALSLLVLVVAAVILIPYVAPPYIERAAVQRLHDMGIRQAHLKVTSIDRSGIAIEGFELGDKSELQVASLSMSLSWLDLFVGKLAAFEISGFRLRLHLLDDGSLSFGALAPLFQDTDTPQVQVDEQQVAISQAVALWPIKSITLNDAAIEVVSLAGTTLLPFEGRLTQRNDGTIVLEDASVKFVSPEVSMESILTGTLDRTGQLQADLQIVKGNLDLGILAARVTRGRIAVAGNLGDVKTFTAEGAVHVQASQAPLAMKPQSRLTVQLRDGDLMTSFSVDDDDSQLSGKVDIRIDKVFSDDPLVSTQVSLQAADISRLPDHPLLIDGLRGRGNAQLSSVERMSTLLAIANQKRASDILGLAPKVQLDFAVENLGHEDSGLEMSMAGKLTFLSQDGALNVMSPKGISVSVSEGEKTALAKILGPFLDTTSRGQLKYLLDNGDQPLIVATVAAQQRLRIATSGRMAVEGGGLPMMEGLFSVSALSGPGGQGIDNISIGKMELSTSTAHVSGGLFELRKLLLSGSGTASDFTGQVAVDAKLSGQMGPDVVIDNGSLSLNIDLAYENGTATVALDGCSLVLVDGFSYSGQALVAGPIDLCLEGQGKPVAVIALDKEGQLQDARFALAVSSWQRPIDAQGSPEGKVNIRGPAMALQLGGSVREPDKPATSKALISGGLFELRKLLLSGSGTASDFSGQIAVDAKLSGQMGPDIVIDNGSLSLNIDLAYENGTATVALDGCSLVLVDGLSYSGQDLVTGPIDLCLEGQGKPVAVIALDREGQLQEAKFSLAVSSRQQRIDVKAAPERKVIIRGPAMALQLGGSLRGPDKPVNLNIQVAGINVVMPGESFSIEGLALDATTDSGAPWAGLKGELKIAALRDHHQPRYFNPVSLVTGFVGKKGGDVTLSGRLQDTTQSLVVEFDGSAHPRLGKGDVTIRTRPLSFGPAKTRAGWMFPVLRPFLSQVRGLFMAAARTQWTPNGFDVDADVIGQGIRISAVLPNPAGASSLVKARGSQIAIKIRIKDSPEKFSKRAQVLLENIYVEAKGTVIEKLNTVINFADLWPLETKGLQEVSIASATLGVPLTDGSFKFSISGGKTLAVQGFAFTLARGTVSAEPFEIIVGDPLPRINMKLENVSLGALVDQFNDSKLSAEGILHGYFPIVEKDGVILIANGWLEGEPGGRISYINPNATEIGGGLGSVTSILENFRYDKLRLDLNGQVDGTIRIGATLSGKNKDYLDGFPVNLSLNLTGRIAEILGSSTGNYEVPKTIKDRLLQFSQ